MAWEDSFTTKWHQSSLISIRFAFGGSCFGALHGQGAAYEQGIESGMADGAGEPGCGQLRQGTITSVGELGVSLGS